MHILFAPNAFKNSLDAAAVAAAIEKGFRQSRLSFTGVCFPVGDGGDGTAKLICERFSGTSLSVIVENPLGKKIQASFGLIDEGRTAVIELADASGLRLLQADEYDPLHISSRGAGQLIKTALDRAVKKIILGLGGSATVDGGAGILEALGIRFLDKQKNQIQALPSHFADLGDIDLSGLDRRLENIELIVLCDVENKLLGPEGAAAVFGPQKGAAKDDIRKLEAGLTVFRDIALEKTGKDMGSIKHGGAAGGTAAGLSVFLGARLVSGIEYFLDLTGFEEALQKAQLVITAEGSIDIQTLQGKAPFGVARRAKKKNIPVIGLAGKVPLDRETPLENYFDILMAIGHEPMEMEKAIRYTENNLIRMGKAIGNLLAFGTGG
jgi:glycerate 2-kinase